MSKKNDDFFVQKKIWSQVKDELLGCYLTPYLSKILVTNKPVVYVDCFAGKGRFDDGKPGSPLIALDIIDKSLNSTRAKNPIIDSYFIDLNYASELESNLSGYRRTHIISGKFEDRIQNILHNSEGKNVFLYIDPYGIKALQSSLFSSLATGRFCSIELLINLNSFGFIREACRALGAVFKEKEALEDLIEYDPTYVDASNQSIQDLNEIAGGDYWKNIIYEYKDNRIDGYQAEKWFAESYCKKLGERYKYVLNMPLRIKENQRPKYRLVHATQHRDGCLIMVDNMNSRWETIKDIQTGGQTSLFETNMNEETIDKSYLTNKVVSFFSRFENDISINDAIAAFFVDNGVVSYTKDIRNILKDLEMRGRIIVRRIPEQTKTGKLSSFMDEKKNQIVYVRWNK